MAGQQHMLGHEHMPGQQHMAFSVGGQNVPRTGQVSQDMGAVSPRTQSFAYSPIEYPITVPQEFQFPQVPVQPRRRRIDHPNQIHVHPRHSAADPEVIDKLED